LQQQQQKKVNAEFCSKALQPEQAQTISLDCLPSLLCEEEFMCLFIKIMLMERVLPPKTF
jgi:hypothetical protein